MAPVVVALYASTESYTLVSRVWVTSTTWLFSAVSRASVSAGPAATPAPTRSDAGSRRNALRYRPCPTGLASANRTVPGRVAVASRRVSACSSDRAPAAKPRSLISRWPCPANRATAGTGGRSSPSRMTPTRSPSGGGAFGSGR